MSEKLLDFDEALERLGGDAEFLTELLEELLYQVDQNYEEIKRAIDERNFDDLKTLSHSLKGASANLNVTRMATHFLKLEDLGNSKRLDGAEELLSKVAVDRDELQIFLSKN